MKRRAVLCLALALSTGCAATKGGEGNVVQRYAGSRQLAQAEDMLARGNRKGALRALKEVVGGPAVAGVTDEALFRLALLTLNPGAQKPASTQGEQLLKRLVREYPKSPWTAMAAPLNELIEVAEEQNRQNKSLKGTNQALTREVDELNRNLEKLKRLDLELEKKAR